MIRSKIRKTYLDYPQRFWGVVAVSFIDRIGCMLLFPFDILHLKLGKRERFSKEKTLADVEQTTSI